ncbi:MAG: choice-of-anchor D domain-containing protein [Deltaproteobacteria bacterium]|nr:choice-of-anchor D domain-containing protein [Deltaproteobacteria bacterium]
MPAPRLVECFLAAVLLQGGCDVHSVCFLCAEDETHEDPRLAISATALDFGPVAVGESSRADLILYNTGGRSLSIVSAEVVGTTPAFGTRPEGDLLLQPGERARLHISFTPVISGFAREELVIESTDPVDPMRSVVLTGEGLAPWLIVDPDALDLGTVQVGCAADHPVWVANGGNRELWVTSVYLESPSAEMDLEPDIASNGPLPWSLAPGEGMTLGRVVYAPLDSSSDHGFVYIETNDPQNPEVALPLSARGELWGQGLDTWTFPSALVDVIAAVDASPEMDAWNEALVAHVGTLTAALDAAGADWRLAVVADDDGCVEGALPYLSAGAEPETVADGVAAMLEVRAGVYAQQAFRLLDLALSTEALGPEGCNAALLRDRAGMHLVGVSHVEERSTPEWEWWVSSFQGRTFDLSQVAFHGIGSDPDDPCPDMEAYLRFHSAAEATGGGFVSLCTVDWDGSLAGLAEAIIDSAAGDPAEAAWPLSQTPVPGTVQVQVDGSTPQEGWSWSEDENALRFHEGSAPTPGSTVTISYALEGPCDEIGCRL